MGWRIRILALVLALAAALGGAAAGHAAEKPPQAVIEGLYSALVGVMKQGRTLGFSGRYDRLRPVLEQSFNLPLMSRLSVGPQWQSLSPEQQQRVTDAFADYSVSTYANRFDEYSGERFEVLPETAAANGGTIVQTRLVRDTGEPVTLNYLMRESDGRWQVIDVFLSGTISELATRRSEFTAVLRRDGAQGLLQLLDRRIAELKAS
jgi:phospholipid transport system substrate-binding protein